MTMCLQQIKPFKWQILVIDTVHQIMTMCVNMHAAFKTTGLCLNSLVTRLAVTYESSGMDGLHSRGS